MKPRVTSQSCNRNSVAWGGLPLGVRQPERAGRPKPGQGDGERVEPAPDGSRGVSGACQSAPGQLGGAIGNGQRRERGQFFLAGEFPSMDGRRVRETERPPTAMAVPTAQGRPAQGRGPPAGRRTRETQLR